jgi:hypothetical protein
MQRLKQFFAFVESLITVVLVLTGVGGIGYNCFREGGWLSQGATKVTDAFLSYPLMALGVMVALFFAYRTWRDRRNLGRRDRVFDYLVYVFMAAGIYFIGHYVITGKV